MRWTKYQLVLVRQEADIDDGARNLDQRFLMWISAIGTHSPKKERLCKACTLNDQDQGDIRN
jgi:hypothetical protein